MKVLCTHADDSSGAYRIQMPAEHLDDASVDVELVPPNVGLPLVVNTATGAFVSVDLDCDVLVLQRPMFHLMPDLIEHVQAKGIAVVVELDDDFHTPHPLNRAFQLNHPRVSPEYNWHWLGRCVQLADLVTVSTDQLARRYGSHGRVRVLRNYCDSKLLHVRRRGSGATLGWAGTLTNHPTDLQATRGGVAMAMDKRPGWRFLCIGGAGHQHAIVRQLEIDPARFSATEWKRLELHHLVVSQLDVGIVPLHDSAFNAAKSWLKGLEYAALGIPFVASDLPEYELLQRGFHIGHLARPKSRDWRRQLGALMDEPYREMLGAQYRATIATHLTIETNAWRWPEAWHEAWSHRRKRAIPSPTKEYRHAGSTRPDAGDH